MNHIDPPEAIQTPDFEDEELVQISQLPPSASLLLHESIEDAILEEKLSELLEYFGYSDKSLVEKILSRIESEDFRGVAVYDLLVHKNNDEYLMGFYTKHATYLDFVYLEDRFWHRYLIKNGKIIFAGIIYF